MIAERWAGFTRRIEGLAKTADGGLKGPNGAAKRMRGTCADVVVDLQKFALEHAAVLPDAARPLFQNRLVAIGKMLEDESSQGLEERTLTALIDLRSLAVEVDFHLADYQAPLRSLAERAFEHLQRSIVADDDIKRKWLQALGKTRSGETGCEALGAVHLLSHGIWAFKAGVRGAVTDLIYQDQAIDIRRVEKIAAGLVLTEWKVSKTDGDKEFREAKWQAQEYAGGALAGLELQDRRYLIMVSKKKLSPVEDKLVGSVLYRHINIAVEPDTPSVTARAFAREEAKLVRDGEAGADS